MTLLTKTECSALRGVAIIGIFLHNYLHWLGPMVKENEYQFFQSNVDWMVSLVSSPDENLLFQLFSFFGHYGVPVFLFLSGYGLVLKYEREAKQPSMPFLRHHFMKLFPMMVLGFVCFAMVDWITPGRHHWAWTDIIAQLTMTINLLPDPDHIIWPGPYWFFGLMMQLYLVYILVIHRYRHWTVVAGLTLLCWALQAMCAGSPDGEVLNRIRYNGIGGMLPFGMGVLLARSQALQQRLSSVGVCGWLAVLGISVVLTAAFSMTFHTWLWVPALIVVVNVAFVKVLPQIGVRALDWVGALSAAIFVCHPITRKIFIPISRGGAVLDGLVLYIVATVMLAMLFRMIISQLQKKA